MAKAGACSAADLTQLQNNFNNPGLTTWLQLGDGLSASCNACVVSKDSDAAWGPIVATAADNGATGFVNFGACFGKVESAACGKSVQYNQFCIGIGCNQCTTTTDRDACESTVEAPGGMCKGFVDTLTVNCPNLATSGTKCGTVLDAVKALCGS